MQPVQLSLIPRQAPAPAREVIASLPEAELAAAIRILAHLMAKAAAAGQVPDE